MARAHVEWCVKRGRRGHIASYPISHYSYVIKSEADLPCPNQAKKLALGLRAEGGQPLAQE
ncbi:hypothetical protein bcgnr5380_57270 [Bacillus cereus]